MKGPGLWPQYPLRPLVSKLDVPVYQGDAWPVSFDCWNQGLLDQIPYTLFFLAQPQPFPHECSELNKDTSLYGWWKPQRWIYSIPLAFPEPALSLTCFHSKPPWDEGEASGKLELNHTQCLSLATSLLIVVGVPNTVWRRQEGNQEASSTSRLFHLTYYFTVCCVWSLSPSPSLPPHFL